VFSEQYTDAGMQSYGYFRRFSDLRWRTTNGAAHLYRFVMVGLLRNYPLRGGWD
jgi:hypothetical protein